MDGQALEQGRGWQRKRDGRGNKMCLQRNTWCKRSLPRARERDDGHKLKDSKLHHCLDSVTTGSSKVSSGGRTKGSSFPGNNSVLQRMLPLVRHGLHNKRLWGGNGKHTVCLSSLSTAGAPLTFLQAAVKGKADNQQFRP